MIMISAPMCSSASLATTSRTTRSRLRPSESKTVVLAFARTTTEWFAHHTLLHSDREVGRRHEALQAGQAAGIALGDIVAGIGDRHEAERLVVEQLGDAADGPGRGIVGQLDQFSGHGIVADDAPAIRR